MAMNDLSPGNKLSLKGKIFELQKKFDILEMEEKITETCPFQPKLSTPQIERKESFLENVTMSEQMRKRRLEVLRMSVHVDESDYCTFKPVINEPKPVVVIQQKRAIVKQKPKSAHAEPIHERLYNKGKEYRNALEDKQKKSQLYDADGRRMFQPKINSADVPISDNSNMNCQEFLYRDAMDRESRMKQRVDDNKSEIKAGSNSLKINEKSNSILHKKADREVRKLFDVLDRDMTKSITRDDVFWGIECLCEAEVLLRDEMYTSTDLVWGQLTQQSDELKPDYISLAQFTKACEVFRPVFLSVATTGDSYKVTASASKAHTPTVATTPAHIPHTPTPVQGAAGTTSRRSSITISDVRSNLRRPSVRPGSAKSVHSNAPDDLNADLGMSASGIHAHHQLKVTEKVLIQLVNLFRDETFAAKSRANHKKNKDKASKGLDMSGTHTLNNSVTAPLDGSMSMNESVNIQSPLAASHLSTGVDARKSVCADKSNTRRKSVMKPVVIYTAAEREQRSKQRAEDRKREIYDRQMAECTFQPKIATVGHLSHLQPAEAASTGVGLALGIKDLTSSGQVDSAAANKNTLTSLFGSIPEGDEANESNETALELPPPPPISTTITSAIRRPTVFERLNDSSTASKSAPPAPVELSLFPTPTAHDPHDGLQFNIAINNTTTPIHKSPTRRSISPTQRRPGSPSTRATLTCRSVSPGPRQSTVRPLSPDWTIAKQDSTDLTCFPPAPPQQMPEPFIDSRTRQSLLECTFKPNISKGFARSSLLVLPKDASGDASESDAVDSNSDEYSEESVDYDDRVNSQEGTGAMGSIQQELWGAAGRNSLQVDTDPVKKKREVVVVAPPSKGFDSTVARMRLGYEQKQQLQIKKETMGQYNEERYKKSRQMAAKGPQPFNFHPMHSNSGNNALVAAGDGSHLVRPLTHTTSAHAAVEEGESFGPLGTSSGVKKEKDVKPVHIRVNVNMGGGKMAPLVMSVVDDPEVVALQFVHQHALDLNACDVLVAMLQQQLKAV